MTVSSVAVVAGVEQRDLLEGGGVAGVGLADGVLGVAPSVGIPEMSVSVESISVPLAVAEAVAITVASVQLGDLLEGASMAGVGLADGVLGLQLVTVHIVLVLQSGDRTVSIGSIRAPLAVSMVEAGVEAGDLLEGAGVAGVGLADGVSGRELVPVDVIVVLDSHSSSIKGFSAPLEEMARMKLGKLLIGSSVARMGLADGISGGQLVTVDVVAVLPSDGHPAGGLRNSRHCQAGDDLKVRMYSELEVHIQLTMNCCILCCCSTH
jgi:hypothetical protein